MSEYGFIKCEYCNIIGNTVVSRTYCEHPLLGGANLLCKATWSFPKIAFCIQMNLICAATYIKRSLQLCRKGDMIKICWRQVETLQLQSFHTQFQSE